MSSWVTIAFTTLGAGAAGALITTYGTQTRERRAARAQARDAIHRTENLARTLRPAHQDMIAALDDLEIRAMIAGLPRGTVDLHRDARMRLWAMWARTPPDSNGAFTETEMLTCGRVASQAAELLAAATWHPWRSAPRIARRNRRLRKILDAGMPVRATLDQESRLRLRSWEKDMLRLRRQAADPETDKMGTEAEN